MARTSSSGRARDEDLSCSPNGVHGRYDARGEGRTFIPVARRDAPRCATGSTVTCVARSRQVSTAETLPAPVIADYAFGRKTHGSCHGRTSYGQI
jgi:hypothetical protein